MMLRLSRWGMMIALVAPALALCACGSGGQRSSDAEAVAPSGLDQIPLTIQMAGRAHPFVVEVARTPNEQAQGLMHRTELAANRGMLFPFNPPKLAAFWMKNTLIPLDMIFVRADGSIDRIAENTVPQSLEPVASGGMVAAVLELPGGTAAELGIDETASVRWNDRR